MAEYTRSSSYFDEDRQRDFTRKAHNRFQPRRVQVDAAKQGAVHLALAACQVSTVLAVYGRQARYDHNSRYRTVIGPRTSAVLVQTMLCSLLQVVQYNRISIRLSCVLQASVAAVQRKRAGLVEAGLQMHLQAGLQAKVSSFVCVTELFAHWQYRS